MWVKNRYTKWDPGKWKHGRKPAVPWWFDFDPYRMVLASQNLTLGQRQITLGSPNCSVSTSPEGVLPNGNKQLLVATSPVAR